MKVKAASMQSRAVHWHSIQFQQTNVWWTFAIFTALTIVRHADKHTQCTVCTCISYLNLSGRPTPRRFPLHIKACPHQATKLPKASRKRQQIVARNGNKLLPETATLTGVATMLPLQATICCRFRQHCCLVWTGL